MLITNLSHHHSNHHDTVLYYDSQMLSDCIIEESTQINENNDIYTAINCNQLKHYNDKDTFHFTLHENHNQLLSSIQTRGRIVNSFVEVLQKEE